MGGRGPARRNFPKIDYHGQRQTLWFRGVTITQARKLKWDYFGVCGAVITCYDAGGVVRYEE